MVNMLNVLNRIRTGIRTKCVVSAAVNPEEEKLLVRATSNVKGKVAYFQQTYEPMELATSHTDLIINSFVTSANNEFRRARKGYNK